MSLSREERRKRGKEKAHFDFHGHPHEPTNLILEREGESHVIQKNPKKNNNNNNKEAPEITVTLSSTPVSTTKSTLVSALLSKSTSRSIATTKSTSTSKLKSNPISTKSTCSASTFIALTPIASTQFTSSLIHTRRFQESFSLDVKANKKKKTNKFEDITASVNFFKRKPSKSFTSITFEYLQHKRNIYEGYWYQKPSFLLIKRNTPEVIDIDNLQ
ncbi:hypothetical protein Glove_396g23 [Diversispora epigaea]|uniref:Uncharacterized protein n=1 Tax=Diversispora epigaea TaxID=1348612 RepID=A0A397H4M6_9GLOM|nr:hypothetical protein Glove_396g23 [Diversispora epigaea]